MLGRHLRKGSTEDCLQELGNLVLGVNIFPSYFTHYRSCFLVRMAETILIDTAEVSLGRWGARCRHLDFISETIINRVFKT